MPGDEINKAVGEAKKTLSEAKDKFPSAPSTTPVAKSKPVKPAQAKPQKFGDPTLAPSLQAKKDNINQYTGQYPPESTRFKLPSFHEGGVVPKDGAYSLQKGETVVPADKSSSGRQSEYRAVFVARQQKRSGGGNKPVTESPEKHDQKKAVKGTKEQKE